jgi:type IV pilus biogenesis protein CpaD/CtpE
MQARSFASPWLPATLAAVLAVALLAGCARQEAASSGTDTPATSTEAEAAAPEGEVSTDSAVPADESATPATEAESEPPKQ